NIGLTAPPLIEIVSVSEEPAISAGFISTPRLRTTSRFESYPPLELGRTELSELCDVFQGRPVSLPASHWIASPGRPPSRMWLITCASDPGPEVRGPDAATSQLERAVSVPKCRAVALEARKTVE